MTQVPDVQLWSQAGRRHRLCNACKHEIVARPSSDRARTAIEPDAMGFDCVSRFELGFGQI
jgi:hypothetical protein